MTDSPRYFRPLELPDYCYIWEAIMWAAFGRFPDGAAYIITDGYPAEYADMGWKIGSLSYAYRDALFQQTYRSNGFWWYESEAAGLTDDSADWAKYERLMRGSGYIRPELIVDEIARLEDLPPNSPEEDEFALHTNKLMNVIRNGTERQLSELMLRPNYLPNLKERLENTPFIEGIHKLFRHHIDRAWVKIFQALVDGKFQAYGWYELSQDFMREIAPEIQPDEVRVVGPEGNVIQRYTDHFFHGASVHNPFRQSLPSTDLIGPLEPMACLDVIPESEFTLTGFAPDAYYRSASGKLWRDVIFPTEAIFELFPRPLLAVKSDRMHIEHLTPDVAISTGSAGSEGVTRTLPGADLRRGPGKPKKANGEIERVCLLLYAGRWATDEKKDAIHADAEKLAMVGWGEKLPRSTFDGWMKRAVPDIAPDTAAE